MALLVPRPHNCFAVDPSLLVQSRASPPGWTGETPVPPPYDSSRGDGTDTQFIILPSAAALTVTVGQPMPKNA